MPYKNGNRPRISRNGGPNTSKGKDRRQAQKQPEFYKTVYKLQKEIKQKLTAEKQQAGEVIAEVGLAPALPTEFIVVRITQSASTLSVTGLNV